MDNEFSLRHIESEWLGGHPINSKLLAARDSGLGIRREVRARDTDLGIISAQRGELRVWVLLSRERRKSRADRYTHRGTGVEWGGGQPGPG